MSERQKQVVYLIARGFSNEEIAETLGFRARTTKAHTDAIRMKLGVMKRRHIPAAYFKATGDNPWPTTADDEMLVEAA